MNPTQSVNDVFGKVTAPSPVAAYGEGAAGISSFLNNLVSLLFIICLVAVIIMILWGALDWILSAGEKEKVAAAQKKITSALVGFVVLALSTAVLIIFGQFTGFEFFKDQKTIVDKIRFSNQERDRFNEIERQERKRGGN